MQTAGIFFRKSRCFHGWFGAGSGPILFRDIDCRGSESTILLCNRSNWFNKSCDHSMDVGVFCSPPSTRKNFHFIAFEYLFFLLSFMKTSKVFWNFPFSSNQSNCAHNTYRHSSTNNTEWQDWHLADVYLLRLSVTFETVSSSVVLNLWCVHNKGRHSTLFRNLKKEGNKGRHAIGASQEERISQM